MKKNYLLLILICVSTSLFAEVSQDQRADGVMTKRGQYILPAKGDYALGVSLTPFLTYFGNIFNNSTENLHAQNIFSNKGNLIRGKYFLTDKSAVRADFGFSIHSFKSSELVLSEVNPKLEVTDAVKKNENQFSLTLGYEMRRGYGRLQGYAGPSLGLALATSSESYTYGNSLDDGESRPLKVNNPSVTRFNVGGFLGVEYFIAPKIAIGGEFNLNLAFANEGRSTQHQEVSKNVHDDQYINVKETYYGRKSLSRSFSGTNSTAHLMVHFYF